MEQTGSVNSVAVIAVAPILVGSLLTEVVKSFYFIVHPAKLNHPFLFSLKGFNAPRPAALHINYIQYDINLFNSFLDYL